MRFWRSLVIMALVLGGAACSSVPERTDVTADTMNQAEVPGIPYYARFWGDALPPWFQERIAEVRKLSLDEAPPAWRQPQNYLAISGGGPDGAFGAGLLNGWTETGNRPDFTIVTGISTGSLTAPFAFLGPDYDHVLKEIYTAYSTDDLLIKRSWLGVATGDSIYDTSPLFELIAKYMDDEAIQKIADENAKGRRLWIGTTNLDAERPVIWNIGAIAASDTPDKAELIHKILLASASIPGAFSPVFIDVEANGQQFNELHVDGGATAQVFLYPGVLDFRQVLEAIGEDESHPRAYVIRNSKLSPDEAIVDPANIFEIGGKSVSSLIRTQGIGSIYAIYLGTQRDGLDFNLAYIPNSFELKSNQPFDPQYMQALYDLGYKMAKAGYPWVKEPPSLEPPKLESAASSAMENPAPSS
jgi:predicted acylesterase/phospholipase RssA